MCRRVVVPMTDTMSEHGLHLIDECLSEDWIGAWARDVVRQVEDYLGKHAAFEAFLGEDD
jgi:hypothetical protein